MCGVMSGTSCTSSAFANVASSIGRAARATPPRWPPFTVEVEGVVFTVFSFCPWHPAPAGSRPNQLPLSVFTRLRAPRGEG